MEQVIVQAYKPFEVTVIDKETRVISPGQSVMTIEDAEKYKDYVFIVGQIKKKEEKEETIIDKKEEITVENTEEKIIEEPKIEKEPITAFDFK